MSLFTHEARGEIPYVSLDHLEASNALSELQHELPEGLADELRAMLDADEGVLFSYPVDMNLLGQYAQEWLVLTDRRCATWTESEDGFELGEAFPLEELKEARLREMTGNHILLVDRGNGWEELARSSNLTVWKLKPTAQVLRKVASDRAAVIGDLASIDLKLPEREVCEKCGRMIRPRLGICVACLNKRQILVRMVRQVLPYLPMALLAFGLLLVTTVAGVITPLIVRGMFDLVFMPAGGETAPDASFWYGFGDPGSLDLLLLFGGILAALIVVPSIVGAVHSYVSSWVGHRIVVDLSNRVFAHMMRLSLSFYHREETGRAMARITRDVGRVHRFISSHLQEALIAILRIVLIVVFMFAINPRLALIVLAPIPILVGASELARRKIHRIYHVLWRRYAAINRFLADTIPGIRVVKAFAQGPRESRRFEGIMDRVFSYEMKATKVRAVLTPVLNLATSLSGLLVYVVGGAMLIRGGVDAVSLGTLVAFRTYMWMFYGPVMTIARILPEFERAATSADRVFEVLDSEPELETGDRVKEMPTIKGRVEFQHVNFGYEVDEPVLKDIDVVVEPGEMIGLVGHSGAGKTTFINLVCHFYKPDEGHVLIDGHDLTKVKVESLRRQIGIVSQEPFLFSGTIAQNIAYGKPGASEMEIIAAAMAANAHEFIISFPEGYDTLVGERGVRVSGGERQRIAIARAILKDPRILILDEATSSVDTETEEKIQEAIRRLIRGRTTFAIAHRLSTLKYANRLLVLEHGRLVEVGTHDELVALDGVYAKLCQKQTELSKITVWQE